MSDENLWKLLLWAADCDRFTMRCPICKTGENSIGAGGGERCFHCGTCGFVERIPVAEREEFEKWASAPERQLDLRRNNAMLPNFDYLNMNTNVVWKPIKQVQHQVKNNAKETHRS